MAECSPSHTTESIPYDKNECGPDCDGVTFDLEAMTQSVDDGGNCTFSWTVRRTRTKPSGSTTFTGTSTLGCPSQKEVVFYCDDAEECAAFKLILKCE